MLEQTEDGRCRAWIDTLPGSEVIFAGIITLDEDDPDPRYQYLIQKCLRIENPDAVERKLRAISEASRHEFPTADIEDMLREIYTGRLTYGGD